jgi:hypothetical protein
VNKQHDNPKRRMRVRTGKNGARRNLKQPRKNRVWYYNILAVSRRTGSVKARQEVAFEPLE